MKSKVLLIDDDHELIHLYTLKFSLDGTFEFLSADTQERGLEVAEKVHPDLILLDLIMPKHDSLAPDLDKEAGYNVLASLKKIPATAMIPVVILTNLDEKMQGNVERAKELGAVDYWVKAMHSPAEVLEKVKQLLQ